ncbi:hypothetical protein EVD20_04320 [Elizabethkingia bruuniana]|nr:hypothetical protein EVD20_04320 [Elizabethkingia bruuniana]
MLGLDLSNDNLKDTPKRVAKTFIKETFSGMPTTNQKSIFLKINTNTKNAIRKNCHFIFEL